MERFRQLSPERTKVWSTQTTSKHGSNQHDSRQQPQQNRKVPVIYYLCRNRQLEHPHFMEVPLSSSKGLYLKDVIERLNALRGRRVASMYSWSFKRSYKNGYVWHDLCDDDLILPAHGNEYVLKGSELFEDSNIGRFNPAGGFVLQNQKALPEPPSARSQEDSSSLSSMNGRAAESSRDDELSPPVQHPYSSTMSPNSKASSWNDSLSLTEYKLYKNDASTQTDEKAMKAFETRDICVLENLSEVTQVKQSPEMCRDVDSAAPSSDRTDTLESLIRADLQKLENLRIIEKEGLQMSSSSKLKPSNLIMQLISCGSISVKDHSFGLIPTYKPTFSGSKFPSPLFSTSFMLGGANCPPEHPCPVGTTLAGTSMIPEGSPTLKQPNSFDTDRMLSEKKECLQTTDSSRNVEENVIRIEESWLRELGL